MKIGIVNQKGGTGKSTLTQNLASILTLEHNKIDYKNFTKEFMGVIK